jgi:hypothetical protein
VNLRPKTHSFLFVDYTPRTSSHGLRWSTNHQQTIWGFPEGAPALPSIVVSILEDDSVETLSDAPERCFVFVGEFDNALMNNTSSVQLPGL